MPKARASIGPDLPALPERRAGGQAVRERLARSAHAVWSPPPGRRDPVAMVLEAEHGRLQAMLPQRHARMRADMFGFLRGSAAVMAADLGSQPHTGLMVQACGDCHLLNFGAYAAPDGQPVFDVNDFDETLPAPFEWDLKRLVASIAAASLVRGGHGKIARTLARRAAHAYRRHMHDLALVPPLDAWRSRIALDGAIEDIADRAVRRHERQRLTEAVEASGADYRKLIAGDGLRLREDRPGMVRLPAHEQTAHAAFTAYLDSLSEERQALLRRYRLQDVVFMAVGVGALGTFCALGLFVSGDGDPLLLQLKQAQPSVLAPYAGASAYAHQGQRVVVGQRLMQAASDVFLGWTPTPGGGPQFYVRHLRDAKLAAIGVALEEESLRFYAKLCGQTLARAHARSADPAVIAGYMGESDAMDDALAEFAFAYAEQVRADHAAFAARKDLT